MKIPPVFIFTLLFVSCSTSSTPNASEKSKSPGADTFSDSVSSSPFAYEIVEVQNISYRGKKRAICRAKVDTTQLPPIEDVNRIANEIWGSHQANWDELSTALYLPGMDTDDLPYVMVEYSANGTPTTTINDIALWGTDWYEQTPTATQGNKKENEREALWTAQRNAPKAIDCSLELNPVLNGNKLTIDAKSNLPDGTVVSLRVTRLYWQRGSDASNESYSHDYLAKDLSLSGGQIKENVVIDDVKWKRSLDTRIGELRSLGINVAVQRVADQIKVSLLYTSHNKSHPSDVKKLLGEKGEYVAGPLAERRGRGTILRAEQTLDDKFDG